MRLTHAVHSHRQLEGQGAGTTAHARRWLPFALLASTALLPLRALADDECSEPAKQVNALAAALNRATAGNPAPGRFDVRRLSPRDEAGRFQVTYRVGSKPVFSQRLEQQAAVSDHFHAAASRKSAAVLELGYALGAGGRISCEYNIGRSPVEFVGRRKN